MFEEYRKLKDRGYTIRGLCQAARKGIRFPELDSDEILSPEETIQMLKEVMTDYAEEEILEFFDKMEYGNTKCWLCNKMFQQEADGYRNRCDECGARADKIWEQIGDVPEENQIAVSLLVNLMTVMENKQP